MSVTSSLAKKKNPQDFGVAESSPRFPSALSAVGLLLCDSYGTLASVTTGINSPFATHTFFTNRVTHLMRALRIHINFHLRDPSRKRSLLPDWFSCFWAPGNSQPCQLLSAQSRRKRGGGEKLATKEALVAKICFRQTFMGSLWTVLFKV